MTVDEFKQALGTLSWNTKILAAKLDVAPDLTDTWFTGTAPVPDLVATWLTAITIPPPVIVFQAP